jgi:hypothetical protein
VNSVAKCVESSSEHYFFTFHWFMNKSNTFNATTIFYFSARVFVNFAQNYMTITWFLDTLSHCMWMRNHKQCMQSYIWYQILIHMLYVVLEFWHLHRAICEGI